jgi:hypothetical protein
LILVDPMTTGRNFEQVLQVSLQLMTKHQAPRSYLRIVAAPRDREPAVF